jgi:hypothetical protein
VKVQDDTATKRKGKGKLKQLSKPKQDPDWYFFPPSFVEFILNLIFFVFLSPFQITHQSRLHTFKSRAAEHGFSSPGNRPHEFHHNVNSLPQRRLQGAKWMSCFLGRLASGSLPLSSAARELRRGREQALS